MGLAGGWLSACWQLCMLLKQLFQMPTYGLQGPSCWHSCLPALGALEQVVRHTSTLSTK